VIGTLEEGQALRKVLSQAGWCYVRADTPHRGLFGWVSFLEGSDQQVFFSWPRFGQPLEPDVQAVGFDGFWEFVQQVGADNLELADDPHKRILGFVLFDPDNQRAVVKEISLTTFKSGDAQKVRVLLDLRKAKQSDLNQIKAASL